MKKVLLFGALFLANLTAQASTKVFFSPKGDFISLDHNNIKVHKRQRYIFRGVSAGVISQSDSKKKAFDQWKNCYEFRYEDEVYPGKYHYIPFVEVYNVALSASWDPNESSLIIDEEEVKGLISQGMNRMNEMTKGKCQVSSNVLVSVLFSSEDGTTHGDVLIAFVVKRNKVYVEFTDVQIHDPYNIDLSNKTTVGLPNFRAPVPVFIDDTN